MANSISTLINKGMVYREDFVKIAVAHIQTDFFETRKEQIFFSVAKSLFIQAGALPTADMVKIELGKVSLNEEGYKECLSYVDDVFSDKDEFDKVASKWLIDESERWCLERSTVLGIQQSLDIIDGKTKIKGVPVPTSAIPTLMSKAISFTYQRDIGHDMGENAEQRYDAFHQQAFKIPLLIEDWNRMTDGGFEKKTLNVLIGPTGRGKTLVMCSLAADFFRQGKKILYITLEMRDYKIAQRIDANLMNIPMKELKLLSKDRFMKKINDLDIRSKIKIREFGTKSAGAAQFRVLLDELRTKKSFVPDVLIVDYMGICRSDEYGKSDNMYLVGKGVAEDLRSLAQEYDVCLVTASQTNRTGQSASDFDMTETSESHGINMTADWIGAIIVTDEMFKMSQMKIKQLKTRYEQLHFVDSFLVNVDYPKMRISDNQNKWSNNSPNPTIPTGRVTSATVAAVRATMPIHTPDPNDYEQVPWDPNKTSMTALTKGRKLDTSGFK